MCIRDSLEGGISPGATVMSWRGVKGGIEAAQMGHEVVMTPTTFAYIDYTQGDPTIDPPIYARLRCQKSYSFEPVPDNYGTKLLTQIAAGDAPDVFQVGDGDVRMFVERGGAMDLSEYVAGKGGRATMGGTAVCSARPPSTTKPNGAVKTPPRRFSGLPEASPLFVFVPGFLFVFILSWRICGIVRRVATQRTRAWRTTRGWSHPTLKLRSAMHFRSVEPIRRS